MWWNGDDIAEWGYDDGKGYAYKNTANNRKLNAVTYDDNGNVVPLSERFNEKKTDIRYSLEAESKVLLDVPSIEKTGKIASAKESAIDKNIQFLISWVNAQAGIEKYAKTLGITGMEAYTNYARAARKIFDRKGLKKQRQFDII